MYYIYYTQAVMHEQERARLARDLAQLQSKLSEKPEPDQPLVEVMSLLLCDLTQYDCNLTLACFFVSLHHMCTYFICVSVCVYRAV